MGFEYVIEADTSNRADWHRLIDRLENPLCDGNWQAYTAEVTDDGVYFCDHGRSPAAAIALRCLLDHALTKCGSVLIRGPG